MQGKCTNCGEQVLVPKPVKMIRLGLPWLNSIAQIETPYACPSCDTEVSSVIQVSDNYFPRASLVGNKDRGAVESTTFNLLRMPSLTMPGMVRLNDRVFIPKSEGRIQDGSVVDQFGDPDLMAEMAHEYLRQYWILLPKHRLPNSLKEIMPPLLLLMTAAEQALKTFGIREGKAVRGHSLRDLYDDLSIEQKAEIERLFRQSKLVMALLDSGQDAPAIEHILSIYSYTYGSKDGVHVDARYYPEPTTNIPQSSSSHGSNLLKSLTPYPFFLPAVVEALLEAYRTTSGLERLGRRGADIQYHIKDNGTGSHGNWGLLPASLGLVVVAVPQSVALTSGYEETEQFSEFVACHPAILQVSWMHGGSKLLFYIDDQGDWSDGDTVVDGLECHVWRLGRLGMHARDLNQLADALDEVEREEGILSNPTRVEESGAGQ